MCYRILFYGAALQTSTKNSIPSKIEKDKKGTIWVYYEPESIYIAIQKDGQFAPPEDIKTFRKAKIKSTDKTLALEGKFYKESPRKTGRLKRLFLTTMLVGTIGFTFLTTTSILLYRHITYDPFGATYQHIEVFEEDRKATSLWEISTESFLNKLNYLQSEELTYNEILDCTNWLNHNIWYIERAREPLDRKDLAQILRFLKNPQPIKSSSVSSRWLVGITKYAIMDLWLGNIYYSFEPDGYEAEMIMNTIQDLTNYEEDLPEHDPLFSTYFSLINPGDILSEMVQKNAKRVLAKLKDEEDIAAYLPETSPSYEAVDRLFRIFGTLEDIETKLNETHKIETADIIEIPIWQLDDVQFNRQLDPKIKTYIEESAKAHNIPPRVILTHLLNVWKRSYSIDIGIDLVVRRGRMSEQQAEWLREVMRDVGIDSTYTFPPDIMAFIGGVVLDAQSTTGIGRLRPVWAQRNQGFDRLGEKTEEMSTRKIAWKLWSPEYNIEAIARLWEALAQEGGQAILDAQENRIFDTRRFSKETGARLFTRNDTARVAFYKLCPSPEIFKSKGEAWMNSVWHPVEIELQLQRMGASPWSYNPGEFLSQQIELARSGLFGPPGQKAIITGVETLKDITALAKFLKSQDSFIRDAVKETLLRLAIRSNNKEIKQKAIDELLQLPENSLLDPINMIKSFLDEGSNIIIFGEDHQQYSHRIMVKDIINSLQPGEVDYLALELSYYRQKIIDDELSKLKESDTDSEKEVRKSLYKVVSSWFDPWLEKGIDAYVKMLLAAHKKGIRIVCIDPRDHRVKYSSNKVGEMPVFVNPEKDGYVMVGGQRKATDEIMLDNILSLQGKVICLIGSQHAMNNWYRDKLPSLGTQIKQKEPSTKLILQHTIKGEPSRTDVDNILCTLISKYPVAIKNLNASLLSNMEIDLGGGAVFGNGDAVILHPSIRGSDIYEEIKTIPESTPKSSEKKDETTVDTLKTQTPISLVRNFITEGTNIIIFGENHTKSSHRTAIKNTIDSLEENEIDYIALELDVVKQSAVNALLDKLMKDDKTAEQKVRKELYKLVASQFWFEPWQKEALNAYVDIILSAHAKGIKTVCIDPREHKEHYIGKKPIFADTGQDGYVTVNGKRKTVDEAMVDNILNLKGKGFVLIGQEHAMSNHSIQYEKPLPSLGSIIKKKDPSAKIILQYIMEEIPMLQSAIDSLIFSLDLTEPEAINILPNYSISKMSLPHPSEGTLGQNGDAIILHPLTQTQSEQKDFLQKNIKEEKQNRNLLNKAI